MSVLPKFIEYYLNITPSFFNITATSYSGREVKNLQSINPKFKYLISNAKITKSQFLHFYEFFLSRIGSYKTFYVKNFLDFQVSSHQITVNEDQKITLQKTYQFSDLIITKNIQKPIEQTIKLTKENVDIPFILKKEEDEYFLQILDDVLVGATLDLSYEFYSKVRFLDDHFKYDLISNNLIKLADIELTQII
ncbi:MAG: DUF2460 domain-containing protein [Rickettsia sp.]|nr:DUF2460 domain-containing protein [Rickettsia sp.]